MRIRGRLTASLLLLVTMLLALVGCAGDEAARPANSGEEASATEHGWDPLAIEEPTIAPPPEGPPSKQQLLAFLDHVGAIYTYGLRTGFEQSMIAVTPSFCDCRFRENVSELADAGLHAEMDEISMKVLKSATVTRIGERTWSLAALVEMSIPERVIADASGTEVRVEPAETHRAGVVLLSDLGEWQMLEWEDIAGSR